MERYLTHKDENLVELSLLGNSEAFEELVRRYEGSVMGTALKVTENRYSAQDASQDAFVSAWINLDKLKKRESFGPWVCTIARNKAYSLVTHYRNAIPDISLDILKISAASDDEDEELLEKLGLDYSKDDEIAELHAAVEALSEKIRDTVKLHYFEGLSVMEISKRLFVPVGTVKYRLSEGRKQLRKEYGIMEKTYDENESVQDRVMRQVEQLKLWRIKEDHTGFEAEYRQVLEAVESLDESKEKKHALADVLLAGYWWIPGKKNDEVLQRMKEAAIEGHNDEVMQSVVCVEYDKYKGAEKLKFMEETQIPWLEENGFTQSLAYAYFWYGYYQRNEGNYEKCMESYKKVLELLTPDNVYYANALAAIELEEKLHGLGKIEDGMYSAGATGEVYKYIDGKLYFWTQPGYNRGYLDVTGDCLFWNCARLGKLILDPEMKVGEVKSSKDGMSKIMCTEKDAIVETPAGTFKNCSVYVWEGNYYGRTYCKTAFAEGVGIVSQTLNQQDSYETWLLKEYEIHGGEGLFPMGAGNKWSYTLENPEGVTLDVMNTFEITGSDGNSATVKSSAFVQLLNYDNSWAGSILKIRNMYAKDEGDESHLVDVSDTMKRARELAETKRQKVHTAVACDIMERIFNTDPEFNPDYTEKGLWNFFEYCPVQRENGKVKIDSERKYSFEWKEIGIWSGENWKILYNFLYDILSDAAGCVWSDEWIPGYHRDEKIKSAWGDTSHIVFDVLDDEKVITGAGEFENCRHISLSFMGKNGGYGYRGGYMEYWFAPEVGIVKFSRPYGEGGKLDCIWELTEYRGKGEGYFPTDDGLFRRYEPTSLGDGYHASVEYTFDTDENGTVMFRNALGTQDRANYEAFLASRKQN